MTAWLTHLVWYALGALVILGLGTGLGYRLTYPKIVAQKQQITVLDAALKTAGEQRKLDQAALAFRAEKNRAAAREMASLKLQLSDALARNRAWAEQAVPQEVQDAL